MPKYENLFNLQAAAFISDLILNGNFSIGDKLPSIRSIMKQTGLGRMPVAQAYKILAQKGTVRLLRGSGAYVMSYPLQERQPHFKIKSTARINLRISINRPEYSSHQTEWDDIASAFSSVYPEVSIIFIPVETSTTLENFADSYKADIIQVRSTMFRFYHDKGYFACPESSGIKIDTDCYYKNILDLVTVNGTLCGLPVITGTAFTYYHTAFAPQLSGLLDKNNGFWEVLDQLKWISENNGLNLPASMLCADLYFFSLLLFFQNIPDNSFDNFLSLDAAALADTLKRLEPYYRNSRLFMFPAVLGSPDSFTRFLSKECAILISGSQYISFHHNLIKDIRIARSFLEPNGSNFGSAEVFTLSAFTVFPEICYKFLNFLGQTENQARFCRRGRVTACRAANKSLSPRFIDSTSLSNLDEALHKITNLTVKDFLTYENIMRKIDSDTLLWQKGKINAADLVYKAQSMVKDYRRNVALKEQLSRPHAN